MNLSVNRISIPQVNHNNLRKIAFGHDLERDDIRPEAGSDKIDEKIKEMQEEVAKKGTIMQRLNALEEKSKLQGELNRGFLDLFTRTSVNSNWTGKDYTRLDSLSAMADKLN